MQEKEQYSNADTNDIHAHANVSLKSMDILAIDALLLAHPKLLVEILPRILTILTDFANLSSKNSIDIWEHLKNILLLLKVSQDTQDTKQKELECIPPFIDPIPNTFINYHSEEWSDDYAFLSDKQSPIVLDYIQRENDYSEHMMQSTIPLQNMLYKEFTSRLNPNKQTAPVKLSDGWTYYTKYTPGEQYPSHCRINYETYPPVEEIFLDENKLLSLSPNIESDSPFFKIGFFKHSPNCKLISFGLDYWGNERYTAKFLNIDSKKLLKDEIVGIYEDLEFGNFSKWVYYTLLDEFGRAFEVRRHLLDLEEIDGEYWEASPVSKSSTFEKLPEIPNHSKDELLYNEEDEMFYVTLKKSYDGKFIFVKLAAQITSEIRYISADDPKDSPHLLIPRRENIQYTCEHHGDYFYILTNDGAKNNYMFRTPVPPEDLESAAFIAENHQVVIEHRDFVLIEAFEVRQNHLIVIERSNCVQNIRIVDLRDNNDFTNYHYIGFSESVYSIWPGSVNETESNLIKSVQFDTNIFRYTYTSFLQPKQVIDYHMDSREYTIVHEDVVGGDIPYDQSLYTSKRLYATGGDGTAVPLSMVYRKDLLGMNMNPPQVNPVLLYAYGAYGSFTNLIFSASRLSLLDRGFIYVAAHVRGQADLGNGWYEEGKLLKKPNTFYDFCAVADYLCKEEYTSPEKLSIYGRSAGGLLIGAVINMRPELFKAALTQVPFVDVINTMFDTTIPWTAFEFEEWGDPRNLDVYEVMKTYCPYTNIDGEELARNNYPNLLIVAGMNDPRVAFFEPLKFVAKMRGEKIKGRSKLSKEEKIIKKEPLLLLKLEDVGHGGNSGQYSYLQDLAYDYAFLISSLKASIRPFNQNSCNDHLDYNTASTPRALREIDGLDYEKVWEKEEQPLRLSDLNIRNQFRKNEDEEKEYRNKSKKGDRGQNKLFQWLNSFGF